MQKMYLNLLVAALLTLPMQSLWAQEDEPAEAEAPVVYDELLLNNGSRILGKVLTYRDGSVQIETDFAGTLTIAAENIASLNTQNPGILQMVDGQILHNATVAAADGQLTIDRSELWDAGIAEFTVPVQTPLTMEVLFDADSIEMLINGLPVTCQLQTDHETPTLEF